MLLIPLTKIDLISRGTYTSPPKISYVNEVLDITLDILPLIIFLSFGWWERQGKEEAANEAEKLRQMYPYVYSMTCTFTEKQETFKAALECESFSKSVQTLPSGVLL